LHYPHKVGIGRTSLPGSAGRGVNVYILRQLGQQVWNKNVSLDKRARQPHHRGRECTTRRGYKPLFTRAGKKSETIKKKEINQKHPQSKKGWMFGERTSMHLLPKSDELGCTSKSGGPNKDQKRLDSNKEGDRQYGQCPSGVEWKMKHVQWATVRDWAHGQKDSPCSWGKKHERGMKKSWGIREQSPTTRSWGEDQRRTQHRIRRKRGSVNSRAAGVVSIWERKKPRTA